MGGVPCIRRLRIPPDLEAADIREALRFAAEAVRARELPMLSIDLIVTRVTNAVTARDKTRLFYLSTALRQHRVRLEEVVWSLYFCNVLLGRIDDRKALIRGQLGVRRVPAS